MCLGDGGRIITGSSDFEEQDVKLVDWKRTDFDREIEQNFDAWTNYDVSFGHHYHTARKFIKTKSLK